MEVEQRSKKTEENKHGAVIAGCSIESETLFWEQKSKFESTRCLYNTDLQAPYDVKSTECSSWAICELLLQ